MASKTRSGSNRVPRHGYSLVTVVARDANGFVHHYGEVETSVGALSDALATLHLHSTAMDAAHRDGAVG